MELYLDSANLDEIQEGSELGILTGLTTTPTFMHREGVKDIDATILQLADMVPVLQIEALGDTADDIVKEAHRLLGLGLDPEKTVFKIPMSLEAVKACKRMVSEGMKTNLHLVYTLQQAYLAMEAGATYICPLVGRLQDQGHDALGLVEQCVDTVNFYQYDSKIMFSSVRNVEHVRNALNIGVDTITVPLKILKSLANNHFTDIGTNQFVEHTRLLTHTVGEVMREANPTVKENSILSETLLVMSSSGFGAVTVIDQNGVPQGIITDGDLRRHLTQNTLDVNQSIDQFTLSKPIVVNSSALLDEAKSFIKANQVDVLVVVNDSGVAVGMIDIHDV